MKPSTSLRAALAALLLGGGILVSAFGPSPSTGRPAAEASAKAPKNYRVIYDTDLQRLVTNVHEAMVANWQVAGGIAVYVSEGKVRYAQAMIAN
ncbi:hypothetical protein [Flaviaesturariibacter terrae]